MPQPTNKIAEQVEVLRRLKEADYTDLPEVSDALSFFIRLGEKLATPGEIEKIISEWAKKREGWWSDIDIPVSNIAQALLTELTKGEE